MFSNSQPDRKDGDSSGDEEAQWKKLGHAAMPAMLFGHLFWAMTWLHALPMFFQFGSVWSSRRLHHTSPLPTAPHRAAKGLAVPRRA